MALVSKMLIAPANINVQVRAKSAIAYRKQATRYGSQKDLYFLSVTTTTGMIINKFVR